MVPFVTAMTKFLVVGRDFQRKVDVGIYYLRAPNYRIVALIVALT